MLELGQLIEDTTIYLLENLRNDPDLVAPLGTNFRYMSDTQIDHVARSWCEVSPQNERCIIYDGPATDWSKALGFISLTNIDFLNRSAEFSLQLLPKYQDKGYGTGATKLMLRHGFEDLNLHRVYMRVLEDNTKSISCCRRAGFKEEGVLKDSIFKQGAFRNQIIMSILEQEFIWLPPNE